VDKDKKMDEDLSEKYQRRMDHLENQSKDFGRYGRTPKEVPPKPLTGEETKEEEKGVPKVSKERENYVRDPVCGQLINPETADNQTKFEKKKYLFCSQKCLDKFKQSPSEFT
jgi:YHS domain-containing protein